MIHVKLPEAFFLERTYLCQVIFKELLGVNYTVQTDQGLRNTVELEFAGKKITVEDDFFSRTSEQEGYLLNDLIPSKVEYVTSRYTKEKDIPLLYGNSSITRGNDSVVCGHDIFASIFFMLTRWEECVIKEHDYLGRFPASAALAVKYNFLHRPVVNEWVELLKNMLSDLSPDIAFNKPQTFRIIFTHDIDLLNSPVSIREFAKDLIKRKSLAAFAKRLGYLVTKRNPYDVFDYFMDVSEKHKTLSRFYFMTGHNVTGKDGELYNHTPFYKKILNHIKNRGHIVGFHPSLLSYNNPEMFRKERTQLESDLGASVVEGRQHALRFKLPDTWNIWEKEGMTMDSTMGYSAREGFRCGTGNIFTVFDVVNRNALNLQEMPLVLMDTTLNVNRKLDTEESKEIISKYLDLAKRYDMPITLLFHNLIDDSIDWKGWKKLYDELFGTN